MGRCKSADLILSDSCTCTKEWAWDEDTGKWYKHEDRWGTEFWEVVKPEGEYVPKWGKGLWEIREEIKWRTEQNPNIKNIIVIIAGNDIAYGKKHCQKVLDETMEYNPKSYSAIPEYSQSDEDVKDKELRAALADLEEKVLTKSTKIK